MFSLNDKTVVQIRNNMLEDYKHYCIYIEYILVSVARGKNKKLF